MTNQRIINALRGAAKAIRASSENKDDHEVLAQVAAAVGAPDGKSLKWLSAVAELMDEYETEAVQAALVASDYDLKQASAMLKNGYRTYDTVDNSEALEQYAEELAEGGGLDAQFLLQYVDFGAVGRDLRAEKTAVVNNGKTFIFEAA